MRLRTFGGLWIQSDPPLAPLGARRMALLALVASAGKRGVSRERVAGILWGEAGEENARHTLSQNLYTLRRETGRDWIAGAPKLCLNSGATSDIGDFLEAIEADDPARAADLYTGTFLQDFQLSGAPEFERWVEEERATLRRAALRSIESLALRAASEGKLTEAAAWWQRLTEIDGLNGQYAAGLMRALTASGDLVAALAHARAHEEMVRRELEADVDQSVRALITNLRAQAGSQLTTPTDGSDGSDRSDRSVKSDRSDRRRVQTPDRRLANSRNSRVAAAAMLTIPALIALAAILFDRLRLSSTVFDGPATLAVGTIRSNDSAAPGAVLRDMLATSLSGISELTVVSNSRLLELMPAGTDSAAGALADAARRAGAGELFEGEMVAVPTGFRLNLRRVNLESGVVQHGYTVSAANPAYLIDSAAAAIARDLAFEVPDRSVTTVRTASPAAYALYEQGLQVYSKGDGITSHGLFRAAFEKDTTFAMAAYYAWLASIRGPGMADREMLERARRLASRTIDRERLLIAGSVSGHDSSVATSVAIAETLAVRYPNDPEGMVLLGQALESMGDYAAAAVSLERAIAIDSTAGVTRGSFCRICFALTELKNTYLWWDSLAAAERVARRLIALRPDMATGWYNLAEPLLRRGRRAEALAALDENERILSPSSASRELLRRDMIRQGDFAEVDQALIADLGHPSSDVRGSARWLLLLSLRNQGRLQEAKALAWDRIVPGAGRAADVEPETLHQMFLAMETGNPAEMVTRMRASAAEVQRLLAHSPGQRARLMTWYLTLAGTALAEAGDTMGVRVLADTVERLGNQSAFGRDPRLHHFLRGLILQRGGSHLEAINEFRRALHSPSDGYTRINYEMARCLLQLGRGADAIAVLQPALRGGVDGSNTYITHTELHEALAQAFESVGLTDSAQVHFRAVERAWRNADPQFLPRYQVAKAKSRGS